MRVFIRPAEVDDTLKKPFGGPRVKVFDGRTGAVRGDVRKAACCWADEKLKLSFCPR